MAAGGSRPGFAPDSVGRPATGFLDCETPLALGDRPVLAFAVEQGALLVTLELDSPPATVPLHVQGNRTAESEVLVSVSAGQVVVALQGKKLLCARLKEPGLVDVEVLDLRAAEVGIFTAPDGLHLGCLGACRQLLRRCPLWSSAPAGTLGRGDGRPSAFEQGQDDDRMVTRVERTELNLTRALSPRRRRDALRIAGPSRSMDA